MRREYQILTPTTTIYLLVVPKRYCLVTSPGGSAYSLTRETAAQLLRQARNDGRTVTRTPQAELEAVIRSRGGYL